MNIQTRLLITYAVRIVFLFFAVWVAIKPDALPEGTHLVTRIGLVALFLVFSVVVGEVFRLNTQFEMFIRALRSAGVKVDDGGRNDREAITILIRALASREQETREKAHRNLVRLTGQDLPPEKEVWETWWMEARKREAGTP